MGFAAVVFPTAFTYAYARMVQQLAAEIMATGATTAFDDRMIAFEEFNALFGLPAIRKAEERDIPARSGGGR